jgi:hypothetical protein
MRTELWICYCSVEAERSEYFPHDDCDGGRPLTSEEMTTRASHLADARSN